MKRICNVLLILIGIAIIVVILLIGMKYAKNRENEKELDKVVQQIIQTKTEEQGEEIQQAKEIEYKGYQVIGILKIPAIELEYPILEQTTNETMKLSVTKFWGNGVNEIGNLSIAGHNNYDGTMFGKTKKLEIGDVIEVTDMTDITKQYTIYHKYITDPNDISVIEANEFGTRELTLITCSNGNKERLIIKARENIKEEEKNERKITTF